MSKTIEELLAELSEDKFKSERGSVNHHSLFDDCNKVLGINDVETENRKWVDTEWVGGSGLHSILLYQLLSLHKRIEELEYKGRNL